MPLLHLSSLGEILRLPSICLILLILNNAFQLLDLNFSECSELKLFLLVPQCGISNQGRVIHLEDFQLLVRRRQFGLKLLSFHALDLLYFVDLLLVYFI